MTVPANLFSLESEAEKIRYATESIRVITELLEALRRHHYGVGLLDDDAITELAGSDIITSGLTHAIEIITDSIDNHTYKLLEYHERSAALQNSNNI
jgi:hypothetical protein